VEKLNKEQLLKEDTVRKVQLDGVDYFSVDDMSKFLKEDFRMMRSMSLSYDGETLEFATIEQIEKARYPEPLSEFNKLLLKARRLDQ